MRDDYLTPVWAAQHRSLSREIHKLIKGLRHGFERLSARQFDAPWRQSAARDTLIAR